MTRIERLLEEACIEMKRFEIEDTTENRIAFLAGMRDTLLVDGHFGFEKLMSLRALRLEIYRLSVLSLV